MNADATLRLVRALCFARVAATNARPAAIDGHGYIPGSNRPEFGFVRLDCGHTVSCRDVTGAWEDPPLGLRVVCPVCLKNTEGTP